MLHRSAIVLSKHPGSGKPVMLGEGGHGKASRFGAHTGVQLQVPGRLPSPGASSRRHRLQPPTHSCLQVYQGTLFSEPVAVKVIKTGSALVNMGGLRPRLRLCLLLRLLRCRGMHDALQAGACCCRCLAGYCELPLSTTACE